MSIDRESLRAFVVANYLINTSKDVGADRGEESGDELDILVGTLAVLDQRYHVERTHIPKSLDFFQRVVFAYKDKEFKKIFRMDRDSFFDLLGQIQNHPIFEVRRQPQAGVELQLAVFLNRLGSKQTYFEIASRFGISEGMVQKCTGRVAKAIIGLNRTYIKWPEGERRRTVINGFKEVAGFPNVIGCIDGTHIPLLEAPVKDGDTYYTRKKRWSLHAQAVVDHEGKFTSYEIGWPGSVNDAKVWRNSYLFKNRETQFEQDDYLLGDSGYPISTILITPFRNTQDPLERRFNHFLSSTRVIVKNAFGETKMRFPLLREMRAKDVTTMATLILCAFILHNFLVNKRDNCDFSDDEPLTSDDEEDMNDYVVTPRDRRVKSPGELKRETIFRKVMQKQQQ
jgi:hypothetical protein